MGDRVNPRDDIKNLFPTNFSTIPFPTSVQK